MTRFPLVTLIAVVLVLTFAAPGAAWHRRRVGVTIGVGPVWWGPPY